MRQILIVEDQWLIADELREDLEERGFIVLGPVMSCSDAIAILANHKPELVLLDTELQDGSCDPCSENAKSLA